MSTAVIDARNADSFRCSSCGRRVCNCPKCRSVGPVKQLDAGMCSKCYKPQSANAGKSRPTNDNREEREPKKEIV